ncbi:MAG TPA: LysM domain-containing protein [Acidimicrobiales bacterium]|nr:LysM domain-containing protein [Acidimicrobiales bacterium]
MHAVVALPYRPSPAVYRRRRVAALLCAMAVAVCAWQGLQQLTDLSGDGPLIVAGQPDRNAAAELDTELVNSARVIVQPGDTLWTIARRVQANGDLRPLVASLDAKRGGRPLQVGETIILPARG